MQRRYGITQSLPIETEIIFLVRNHEAKQWQQCALRKAPGFFIMDADLVIATVEDEVVVIKNRWGKPGRWPIAEASQKYPDLVPWFYF